MNKQLQEFLTIQQQLRKLLTFWCFLPILIWTVIMAWNFLTKRPCAMDDFQNTVWLAVPMLSSAIVTYYLSHVNVKNAMTGMEAKYDEFLSRTQGLTDALTHEEQNLSTKMQNNGDKTVQKSRP